MKKLRILANVAIVALAMSSCSDLLDETPRTSFTPEYYNTADGINSGIVSLYADMRYIYGNGYWLNACETGTDEYTYGHGADANYKDLDLTGVGQITPSSSRSDVLWNNTFRNINTSNGILEKGPGIGVAGSLLAEASFFRGFDYFNLVQTFGGVPLDLGSGELAYNITPSRLSKRNTVSEVYTKAIFPDLLKAISDLPASPRLTGTVTKTTARLFLAKAYLSYGWWLQNPNNIPTYPEVARVDPNGHDAQWYFQQAYTVALEGINNPGIYALQSTYYDVNLGSNDRNKEMMLYADHTESSEYYDGSSHSYNTGASPGNFAAWMVTWDYTFLESSQNAQWGGTSIRSVQREAAQAYGRPWKCMAPPIEVFKNTFADKTLDSRYDGTFASVLRGNWNKAGITNQTLYNANGLPVKQGDAILTFLNEEPATAIDYSNTTYKSNVGAGVLPGRADYVVSPNGISRYMWPNLWKIGTYRTDNGTGLGQPNGGITRPFPIAKFSELYFVAAEAAVKGASGAMSARDLINVIRARAGKWRWSNNGNVIKTEDNSAAMIAATPSTITIDYILQERSREYFGEGLRWHDLVRTQKWGDVAKTYSISGTAVGAHTPQTYTRTIPNYLYLRPIPQSQMERLDLSGAELAAYQNPGY
ncbi:RagB/SusD family nutrient uptake outer membrane protein [Chryseobacterium sp. RG1]|uniref:RagB/SusD family nutrient uptake outer membrane protein n=1 Tax=Chryseobacterium tagetis TaxID=2801334 RepID=A0ABS7ZW54_9FLAO|nr:RagB/SusD family nutrient uptake outer membrane protein [Chryseobacterium tagetis]MCA6065931.1 RagB/SusD family nutrient uptake outer membrane protein [Chryseobacterium tagetis]